MKGGEQLVITPKLLKPVLVLSANFIDRLHQKNIAHGDFHIFNMVVINPSLKFIDFEFTKRDANELEMGRDIINLLEDLMIKVKACKPWITRLLDDITHVITEERRTPFGKIREVTYKTVNPEVIGNFKQYI